MVETDYPHGDGTWPTTQDEIDAALGSSAGRGAADDHPRERGQAVPPPPAGGHQTVRATPTSPRSTASTRRSVGVMSPRSSTSSPTTSSGRSTRRRTAYRSSSPAPARTTSRASSASSGDRHRDVRADELPRRRQPGRGPHRLRCDGPRHRQRRRDARGPPVDLRRRRQGHPLPPRRRPGRRHAVGL